MTSQQRVVETADVDSGEALRLYESQGAVLVDTPFSTNQVDMVEAAWDRCQEQGIAAFDEPVIVEAIQHPFWEKLTKEFLRAEKVVYWWTVGPHNRPPAKKPEEGGAWPRWQDEWREGAHTDIQLTRSDWNATPRRNRMEIWWWLTDVEADRGAMRILPGSMNAAMDHWEQELSPMQKKALPRVHGYAPLGGRRSSQRDFPEFIPDVPGEAPWVEQEPAAAVAKRGQALIFCSANLHSGWHNEHSVSRKTLLMAFAPAGVACGAPFGQVQGQGLDFFRELRPKMRSDRVHLVPSEDHWPYFFEGSDEARGDRKNGNYTREWLEGVRPVDTSAKL